jgi:hypothetical protein
VHNFERDCVRFLGMCFGRAAATPFFQRINLLIFLMEGDSANVLCGWYEACVREFGGIADLRRFATVTLGATG